MIYSPTIEKLFNLLPTCPQEHMPTSKLYEFLKEVAQAEIKKLLSETQPKESIDFKPFGPLLFPYRKMGAIDSLDLFGLDELILFSFYWTNRKRYKKVADIGANIGLHSIILSKCGYEIKCFEPDPKHFEILSQNLQSNDCRNVSPINSAVSDHPGIAEFLRVLGNTTGSHLAGSKENVYGDIEKIKVPLIPMSEIIGWADFIKIDAEGHEKDILLSTTKDQWQKTDSVVEIGNAKNAEAVFDHFKKINVNLFSQKINWGLVVTISDMPTSYHDGSLFISTKQAMPWK